MAFIKIQDKNLITDQKPIEYLETVSNLTKINRKLSFEKR